MRGSGWATDWPTAVQGLHELTHAADILLRKGAGLILLLAQEKPTIRRNALARQGNKSSRSAGSQAADGRAAPPCAVPLRLAALASVGQRTEEHSLKHPRKSNAMKKEFHKIISGQHIRVARNELPLQRKPLPTADPASAFRATLGFESESLRGSLLQFPKATDR